MDRRLVIILFVVGSFWSCDARNLIANHVAGGVLQFPDKLSTGESQHGGEEIKNGKLCLMCEEFVTEALNYIADNKTQSEILKVLHKSCSKIPPYEQQCIRLVDYYAPLFFLEASKAHAEEFCTKFGLCGQGIPISQPLYKDKCKVCHDVITEALLKLEDPDTAMEIVQLLLKACDSVGKSVKKCKRLVFEYAPVILVNAEQFLEANDVCTILHLCNSTAAAGGDGAEEKEEEVSTASSMPMHASS
ncbi:uncharacterized protein LOC127251606 [Andrographis paniculata]|uniref:uncharacterized protein LOC127251606 n=1 Tax=Andrographis paniculata TaxID=175694 RepID=UPI0021E8719C|nr:uncharacterized protein LOC127251606 [Andrographis paniculata]